MPEDRQLLKALQRGETAAWRGIYLKYKDDMLTVARSLVYDVNTAEDCLQEVFVLLASNGCKVRGNLKGYLLSCVVREIWVRNLGTPYLFPEQRCAVHTLPDFDRWAEAHST